MLTPEQLTAAIEARQAEVDAYQHNIDTFTALIGTLPNTLPAHLEAYRGRTDRHDAAAEIEDIADVELLSDVWFHDELKARIRSEIVEKRKAQAILASLQAQV
jgi:hypothetical protein